MVELSRTLRIRKVDTVQIKKSSGIVGETGTREEDVQLRNSRLFVGICGLLYNTKFVP